MTASTDTLTIPAETEAETAVPPSVDPSSTGRRATFGWIAVGLAGLAVAALAFATFTGGGDSDGDIPAQGFYPEAEAIERQAHLEGQARTYLGRPTPVPADDAVGDPADAEFLPGSRHVPTS